MMQPAQQPHVSVLVVGTGVKCLFPWLVVRADGELLFLKKLRKLLTLFFVNCFSNKI